MGTKVQDCIHVFMDLTMQDPEVYGHNIIHLHTMLTFCQVYPVIQQIIWAEFSKLMPLGLDIVIEELIQVAIKSGTGSQR